jgi:hypothetical protein
VVAVTNKYSVSYENNRTTIPGYNEINVSGVCGSYKNVGGGGKYRWVEKRYTGKTRKYDVSETRSGIHFWC